MVNRILTQYSTKQLKNKSHANNLDKIKLANLVLINLTVSFDKCISLMYLVLPMVSSSNLIVQFEDHV